MTQALGHDAPLAIGFALPWLWDGEWFALADVPRLTFIAGPLGSGKTRFARRPAAEAPDAAFLGLDRHLDPAPATHVARTLTWLVEDGAELSEALAAPVAALEAETPPVLVVDMVEDGLGAATQAALMAHLRLRGIGQARAVPDDALLGDPGP